MIDRKQRLGHVTSKTLAALRRNTPQKLIKRCKSKQTLKRGRRALSRLIPQAVFLDREPSTLRGGIAKYGKIDELVLSLSGHTWLEEAKNDLRAERDKSIFKQLFGKGRVT